MDYLKHGNKLVDTIFVHQATTRPEWMEDQSVEAKRDEIDRWHRARGWNGIGYHYVIDRDGKVAKGRDESRIGAHVANHNTGSIGICLIGGHGASMDDPFSRNFTPQQDAALRELIEDIKTRAKIKRIRGHNEVANKVCPGFNVAQWLKEDVPPRTNVAQSKTVQMSATQLVTGVSSGAAAVGMLSGTAQIIAVVVCSIIVLSAAYVMRERIKHWAEGVR